MAIIGGGVSGLSAGGFLSRNGFKVTLYEANDKLGGSCANTILDGYTFHDGALYLAFPGVLEHVFEKLGLDRSKLLPLRRMVGNETILPDGSVVTFGEGRTVTIKGTNGDARSLQLQWEVDRTLKKWEPVFRLFADDIFLRQFSMSHFLAKGWRYLPKLRGTVATEINKLFIDEAVRAAMSGTVLFAGTPPEKTPTLAILGLVAMLTEGLYLPEGGMGRIPEALSQSLKNNGGEIFLNSKIERIVIQDGRVVGLQISGQELVEADYVISTVSGMMTYDLLLSKEDVPGAMRKKVQNAPLSHKAVMVQLGLSNKVKTRSHAHSILPFMREQAKALAPSPDGVKWLTYSVPTVTLPELAPAGGSIIEMFPAIRQDVLPDNWSAKDQEKVVESAIGLISRSYDIKVAVKRITNPKDFQNKMHLYKGAIYGLSPSADPRAQFPHVSPVRGLYQAGQTTFPGFGVSSSAISGVLAAEALMKKENL